MSKGFKGRKEGKNTVIQAAIGFLASLSLASSLSISMTEGREAVVYSNSFLSFLMGIFCAIVLVKVEGRSWQQGRQRSLWQKGTAGVFSFLFSFALLGGKQLETKEDIGLVSAGLWINLIVLTIFFTPLVSFVWEEVKRKRDEGEEQERGKREGEKIFFQSKSFYCNWLILFLCWIPVFLAFYPGAFVYDATDEYVQVATRSFTTHHPLLHVLLLGGTVAGGNKFFSSFNLGIAVYTLFQMMVLSGILSYTILWIGRRIRGRGIQLLQLLFYGFFPVIPMYAVCSAKDGLFTGALLLTVLQMLTLFEDPEEFFHKKENFTASVCTAAVMMLLRNNGKYAYLVWIIVAVISFLRLERERRREWGKKAGFLFFGAGLLFFMVSEGLAFALNASPSGSQEILTVPIQQLARTFKYSPEIFTAKEKELLFTYLSEEDLKTYHPRLSDVVKSKFDNEAYRKDKGNFIRLWMAAGVRKPLTYLNAWLLTSYGFWYPDAVINVYGGNTVYTYTYEESSYFGFETEAPGTRESRLPWLEEIYRKLSLELYQQKVPGISMLFSPGFLFWGTAFCLGSLVYEKRWKRGIPLLLIFLVWLTFLLGPTYLVRYALILWFGLPPIVSSMKV